MSKPTSTTWIESQQPLIFLESPSPAFFIKITPVRNCKVPELVTAMFTSKAVVQVPEVDTGHAPLEVHLPVLVEGSVGVYLQLSQPFTWHGAIVQWWLVLVAPR